MLRLTAQLSGADESHEISFNQRDAGALSRHIRSCAHAAPTCANATIMLAVFGLKAIVSGA